MDLYYTPITYEKKHQCNNCDYQSNHRWCVKIHCQRKHVKQEQDAQVNPIPILKDFLPDVVTPVSAIYREAVSISSVVSVLQARTRSPS
jgi:hypothetical protein